jgi:endonuclease YncB( thermonuclease family)
MIPKSYFENEHVIYGFTERVIDGDTIRVRHIPNYILKRYVLQKFHKAICIQMMTPLQQRGIAQETLSIRLYGVDCPELSKKKSQPSQPFAIEAKEMTTQLCHHQIVKITLLRKDQYQRAVAKVEVYTTTNTAAAAKSSLIWSRRQRKQQRWVDVSMVLAEAGLAELYTNGGAEYHHSYHRFVQTIQDAQRHQRGIWSIPHHQYMSAAQYKERRGNTPSSVPPQTKVVVEGVPAATTSAMSTKTKMNANPSTKKRVNGYVVNAAVAGTDTAAVTAKIRTKIVQSRNRSTTTTTTTRNNKTGTTGSSTDRRGSTAGSTMKKMKIDLQPTSSTISDTSHYHRSPLRPNRKPPPSYISNNTRNSQYNHHHHHHHQSSRPVTTDTYTSRHDNNNKKKKKNTSNWFETAVTGLEILG